MPLRYEVILKAGIEGGGFSLLGLAKTKGWLFTFISDDITPQILYDCGSKINKQTRFVDTWSAALDLIGRYQWETFRPIVVHPEFRKLIYETYVERFKFWNIDIKGKEGKWKEKCFEKSEEIYYWEQTIDDLKRSVQGSAPV